MTNLMKKTAFAAVLGCLVAAMPVLAQNNNCQSIQLLLQGKLDFTQPPPLIGWYGKLKGLLIDRDSKVPLNGTFYGYPTGAPVPTTFAGQVGHETLRAVFDFGPTVGKFATVLDREIAQYSPKVSPHFEFNPSDPAPRVWGRTMATVKVAPDPEPEPSKNQTSGWFTQATGRITLMGTFVVNAGPPADMGFWSTEISGTLCNVAVPPQP